MGANPRRKARATQAKSEFALKACASLTASHSLRRFAPLLRLQREGCRGPREQPRNADGLPGFFTPALASVPNALKRTVDRMQVFALAITHPELNEMILFE